MTPQYFAFQSVMGIIRSVMTTVKRLWIVTILRCLFLWLLIFPPVVHASFIESSIGTAVVNDATASYYNPAALVLLKNPQIIPQETLARFQTRFAGQSTPVKQLTETGSATSITRYESPNLYLAAPVTNKIMVGFALVSNAANRNTDENAILRYAQSNNNIEDLDAVPALAIKINDNFSIGAGINFSYANFTLQPIIKFPGSNIVDSQNRNESDGSGRGGNAGFLLKLNTTTMVGFNYRSMTTYHLSGKSIYEGNPQVVSTHYHFNLQTPPRGVFSINHFFTSKIGLIVTIQRIKWNVLKSINVYGIAGALGSKPIIFNGTIPYFLRDTWLFTLGSHYRITPKWILRVAGSFNQSPGNPHYQIANGNSTILGASMGYIINNIMTIDTSYAHAFINDENINIQGNRYFISGINKSYRDSVSLKLTFNV